MPILTLKFEPNVGPILTVGIGKPFSILTDEEKVKLDIRSVRLLVDTGAGWTSISPKIASTLGLPILGQTGMRSATHEVASNLYLADLIWTVGQPFPLRDVTLLEFPMANDQIDGLLGRDLLTNCLMILNGPSQTITLSH